MAHAIPQNVLTTGHKRLADMAAQSGQWKKAHALFSKVCQRTPADVEAWVKLALLENKLGRPLDAQRCAERALLLNPALAYGHYALGQALHIQQRRAEAIASYRNSIRLQPQWADTHYLLGLALQENGAMDAALTSLQHALSLRPAYPEALAAIGAACLDLGQLEDGLNYLQQALTLRPLEPTLLVNMSLALRLLGRNAAALAHARHAQSLLPNHVDLNVCLAGLLEQQGALDEAQSLLNQSLLHTPTHPAANLTMARVERRQQRLPQAAERLHRVLVPTLPVNQGADIRLELAQIYDLMGHADRAFPLMVEGKRQKALASLGKEHDPRNVVLAEIASMQSLVTPELAATLQAARQREVAGLHHRKSPVFLIGFPRSGTTLMEQILGSHPDVQTLEEQACVGHMVRRALPMIESAAQGLSGLQAAQVQELRALYFSEVAKHLPLQDGKVFIDKLPLNLIHVPVMARVFPEARFILALRHPCDVSLSCLMQNFAVNASMAHFFSLQDTVHFYAQVMGAWAHYAQHLPLNVHPLRYEDLVDDVATHSRALLAFLDLPWDDAVLQHTQRARRQGAINTPSYHQVVQPVYQHAKYRWERYAQALAPVLPVLQPFIHQFGYA